MKSLPPLMQKVSRLFHQKRMFWRILAMYLAGSILLLTIFSAVLTVYLTRQATQETISRNNDALGQAYAAADYILNTAYETYYKMYQSYEATDILFADTPTTDAALTAAKLFKQINTGIDCVESVYFVNRAANRVYASDGRIATLDEFYDPQALRLFQFYNENSNTLFLPRKTTFPDAAGQQQEHSYITLIFSRRNAVMVPMGGMVVNLDEERLIDLITQDLETADDLYIVSENGSILANTDPKKVNTSIYGSDLWEQITAEGDKQEFSFHTEWDSQNCLVTVRNAPRLRFSFLRITPMAQINASVAYIRSFALVCSAVFLFVAFLLAAVASRYIYRPLSGLVTSLRSHTDARPVETAEAAPMDEVAFLGKTYESLYTEMETLAQDNRQMARMRRREILTDLLLGRCTEETQCRKQLASMEIEPAANYAAAVVLIDDFGTFSREHSVQDLALFRYAAANIAEELLADCGRAYCAEMDSDQIAVLLCLNANAPDSRECFAHLCAAVQEHLHKTVTCGIGGQVTVLTELVTSYNRAMTAAGYRLVQGCSSVIDYRDIAARQTLTPEYPLDTDAAIVQALRSRSAAKAEEELDSFFAHFALANIDSINMATTQLAISLSRTVHSMAAVHEGTRQLPNYRVVSGALAGCDTLEQRKAVLKEYCGRVIELRNSEAQAKKENQIDRIKEFIETNYTNPMLNTEDIAAYAELSPNYLRTVFKNATGKSPTDYLTDYRMERAMELLVTTGTSTKDIAAAVGYYNHRYFYSVFKAKTGMTATEYRKAQQADTAPKEGDEA